jgi:hypothetical protein
MSGDARFHQTFQDLEFIRAGQLQIDRVPGDGAGALSDVLVPRAVVDPVHEVLVAVVRKDPQDFNQETAVGQQPAFKGKHERRDWHQRGLKGHDNFPE